MTYAVIVDSPADIEFHRTVNARLGHEQPGFIASFAGETPEGLRVISVWSSKADADRFFVEDLGPLVAELVGQERAVARPNIAELDVAEWVIRSGL
jgi:hypothetical protein